MDDKLLISCQFTLSSALRQHLVAQTGYFDLSIACFSDPCHLLAAKCAILCPDLQNFEITKYFIVSFPKSGDKIAHLAGV